MTVNAVKISDGQDIYKVGSTVELMLQVSSEDMSILGEEITVHIKDIFGNVISSLIGNRIGNGLYVAEYIVPINLGSLYNIGGEEETGFDSSLFFLQDEWELPGGAIVSYGFLVSRSHVEQAAKKDSIFTVTINGINGSSAEESVDFTSEITKYYATIEDVVSISRDINEVDKFDIVRQIYLRSSWIDTNMKPNVIVNPDAFKAAVRCWVSRAVVLETLRDSMWLEGELKALDTLKIERRYSSDGRVKDLEHSMRECALIVMAGGLNTPFTSKNFQKGIYDPNRPKLARGRLDISNKLLPWVNHSEGQSIAYNNRGEAIEIRGIRTLSLLDGTSEL